MRRARDWILVDARIGHEYPARDVLLVATSGHDGHSVDGL